MASSNALTVIPTPLPVAANVSQTIEPNSVPAHVVCKVVRSPYEGEKGTYESIEGFFSGISFKVITSPDAIAEAFQPLLEPVADISGQWKVANLAVVGGFYCRLGKDNEIQNPTGVIVPPSRQNKYGTIDIAHAPNGLLYLLQLQNREGRYQQILYFDPQRDLKESRINKSTPISFPEGPKPPNLQLFADSGEETVGHFPFRKNIRVAKRPIGIIPCYVLGDIKT